jgi:hypothetical protein
MLTKEEYCIIVDLAEIHFKNNSPDINKTMKSLSSLRFKQIERIVKKRFKSNYNAFFSFILQNSDSYFELRVPVKCSNSNVMLVEEVSSAMTSEEASEAALKMIDFESAHTVCKKRLISYHQYQEETS